MGCAGRVSQAEGKGVCISDLALMEAAREALGFQLTGGQEGALDNVLRDLEGPASMMSLLQVRPTSHCLSSPHPQGALIKCHSQCLRKAPLWLWQAHTGRGLSMWYGHVDCVVMDSINF
jgi:hypothetical protein